MEGHQAAAVEQHPVALIRQENRHGNPHIVLVQILVAAPVIADPFLRLPQAVDPLLRLPPEMQPPLVSLVVRHLFQVLDKIPLPVHRFHPVDDGRFAACGVAHNIDFFQFFWALFQEDAGSFRTAYISAISRCLASLRTARSGALSRHPASLRTACAVRAPVQPRPDNPPVRLQDFRLHAACPGLKAMFGFFHRIWHRGKRPPVNEYRFCFRDRLLAEHTPEHLFLHGNQTQEKHFPC